MAWEWSHTQKAYANAQDNTHDLPADELRVIWQEWIVYDIGGESPDAEDFHTAGVQDNAPEYRLAELVWERAEQQRLCDNDGWNAWICPYGCHTVSFDR